MFATNPCYRWQNHGEFAMLFNAVLHWNDRPCGAAARLPRRRCRRRPRAGNRSGPDQR